MKNNVRNGLMIFLVVLAFFPASASAQVIYEAEDAFISAGTVENEHAGYTGDGFADTENELDVYIEWTVNSPKVYDDTLAFRYALGKPEHRTMQVVVNEELIDTIDFNNTVEFTTYVYKYTVGHLVEGANSIRLVSINAEGAPNLDHLMLKLDTALYYEINLDIDPGGSVALVPEADSFLYGTRIKLYPAADTGYAFNGWSGDASGTSDPLTFTIDKEYAIGASFSNITLAFPGAEGFGGNVTGGRGGVVYEVTNLNNSGAGSLREAVSTPGARTIVFRVSGTIQLESNLTISSGDITIAGQTAPGGGITLSGYPLKIEASNVIVRYIRSRLGDYRLIEDDAMNGRHQQGVMLDHCTMSWSVDETASFYDNADFTMQYCIISESLYHSVHDKGDHGYGGIWGGQGATFHHNLIAHHTSRNPRFCGSRYTNQPDLELVDFRNNVIFNWGYNSVYGAEGGSYNIVNNYYKRGPATGSNVRSRIIAPDADDGTNNQPAGVLGIFYVNGNYVNEYPAVTLNNWAGVHADASYMSEIRSDVAFATDSVTTHEAEIALEHVLAQAGVILPKRDSVDVRVINEVITGVPTYGASYGEGRGIIDTPEDVGGWPELESGIAPTDTDHDGMPDNWENANGLNANNPDDRNGDTDGDGFTNLEEYLNDIVAGYTYIIRPLHLTITGYGYDYIELAWEDVTDDETHFLLERKIGEDGTYTQVAEIAPDETSYSDPISTIDLYTYRLRSCNDKDTSLYTTPVSIDLLVGLDSRIGGNPEIRVAPNPFHDELSVSLRTEVKEGLTLTLSDITGRTLATLYQGELPAGEHKLAWALGSVPEGIYYLTIETDNNKYLKKLIKQ
ncbi:MAG: T9SS type A sorting domain-containing protein [Bacteroidales bacterium]|nr:T9SS type A sorting domain-containing protein [Bacteroidales bacterium]